MGNIEQFYLHTALITAYEWVMTHRGKTLSIQIITRGICEM